jgi:hypothetical protein
MNFNIRTYIQNVNDIPSGWIFSYYLKLDRLTGQSIKMNSVFNPKDTVPSLIIYYNRKNNKYTFKDFSSGLSGGAVDFMKNYWKTSFVDTANRIITDYQKYGISWHTDNDMSDIKAQGWQVTEFKVRKWNDVDKEYWNPYHISTDILTHHNVKPLSFYTMTYKVDNEVLEEFTVKGKNIYGYFYGTEKGNLAKIYQPLNKDKRFIKVTNYLQGSDQNTGEPYCFIMSSLKDIMAMRVLGIKADFIAPDSENSYLSQTILNKVKKQYGKGNYFVIFDNDVAGIKAMQRYKEDFKIPFCYLPYEKDPAEILKTHDVDETRRKIVPILLKKLNNE